MNGPNTAQENRRAYQRSINEATDAKAEIKKIQAKQNKISAELRKLPGPDTYNKLTAQWQALEMESKPWFEKLWAWSLE
tara:strand:- start:149 stop:385 length:237 start_codon:yes stop_codon:yes gene_type:complete